MSTVDARIALAQAITIAGLDCTPYPTDSPSLPSAFIDSVNVVFDAGGWTFCESGLGEFLVVTLEQRNDLPSAMRALEEKIPAVAKALEDTGARVSAVNSGSVEVGGQSVPAVTYQVQAGLGVR